MPGGQYTNLREQARGLGIEDHSWPEVARAYAQVNEMFGNIIKVTPTSKVVGDLAIFMVTNDLAPDDVLDPAHDIAFPQSVVDLFKGELGQPLGGFPSDLKAKILKGETPITVRPGSLLDPVDLAQSRADAEGRIHRKLTENELSSYLMYPQIFVDYAAHRREFGDVSVLPTPVFFYGPQIGEEIFIDLEPGKRLILRYLALGEANDKAMRTVFFELNGQPRTIRVLDKSLSADVKIHRKADEAMAGHIAAPMPGLVVSLSVAAGDTVAAGDQILTIEAMKMETTLYTEIAGTIAEIVTGAGDRVEAKDLLVVIEGE
jgi:pyruvate carboxylase